MAAKRYSLVFYVAIVVAVVAAYSVWRVIESTKEGARVATAPVVVAAQEIAEGVMIDRIALTVAQWPVTTIPVGAYGTVDSVVSRVARVPIFAGEPIVPGRLAPQGTDAGLVTKISPGKRAMSVRINDVSGVSGLIQPNSRVDIMLTTTLTSGDRTAKIFMSNMRVLSIGTTVHNSEDGRPIPGTTASLEVSPEEGELLGVAQSQGSIQLILRGYGETDSSNTSGATGRDIQDKLRGTPVRTSPPRPRAPARTTAAPPRVVPETVVVKEATPVAPPKPDTARVEVFRAGQKEEYRFQRDTTKRDSLARRDTLVRRDTLPR
jgi:pilus assembly protein CpaB